MSIDDAKVGNIINDKYSWLYIYAVDPHSNKCRFIGIKNFNPNISFNDQDDRFRGRWWNSLSQDSWWDDCKLVYKYDKGET